MSSTDPRVISNAGILDDETAANAPGYASLLERLAGNARRLYELLTGEGIDGGPPGIGRNPQGRFGRDYSGPPFGPAPRHPLLVFGGVYSTTHIVDPGWSYLEVDNTAPLRIPFRVWVRGHNTHPGAPYSRGYWSLYARRATTGSHTITFSQSSTGGIGPAVDNTLSISGSTSAFYDVDADGGEATYYLPLVPGINEGELVIESGSATKVYIHSLVLNQVAKLEH